jgi:hypothetical protein
MARLLLGVVLLFVVAACGGTDWEDPWHDARGHVVGESVISTVRGAEHCGWESAVFLWVGWPLGSAAKTSDSARQYVRDPEGLFPARDFLVPLDLDANLPGDATYTGYHLDGVELWISEREAGDAVYLVDGKQVERWPRRKEFIACA